MHYTVYASHQERLRVLALLRRSWEIVYEQEGDNDGVVSAASQSWAPIVDGGGYQKAVRQEAFPIPADHVNQLGWWNIDRLRPDGPAFRRGDRASARGTRWWHFDLRREIRAFEDQVRATYLKMAQDAARVEETTPA